MDNKLLWKVNRTQSITPLAHPIRTMAQMDGKAIPQMSHITYRIKYTAPKEEADTSLEEFLLI